FRVGSCLSFTGGLAAGRRGRHESTGDVKGLAALKGQAGGARSLCCFNGSGAESSRPARKRRPLPDSDVSIWCAGSTSGRRLRHPEQGGSTGGVHLRPKRWLGRRQQVSDMVHSRIIGQTKTTWSSSARWIGSGLARKRGDAAARRHS